MISAKDYLRYPNGRDGDQTENDLKIKDAIAQLEGDGYPAKPKNFIYRIGDNVLLFWTRLPSRTKKALWYDCIIMFTAENQMDFNTTLLDMPFKAFSNSPSFYYRYGKAFKDAGMLIGQFKYKFDDKVLTVDPTKTNPDKKIGYERTIYTALFMQDRLSYLAQPFRTIFRKARRTDWQHMAANVKTQLDLEEKRILNKDTKKEAQRKNEVEKRKAIRQQFKKGNKSATPSTPHTKHTARTKYTKETSTTKHTAKTKTI